MKTIIPNRSEGDVFLGAGIRCTLTLEGMSTGRTNPVFEIYRAALLHDLKGFVRKGKEESLLLVFEAKVADSQSFMSWLNAYALASGLVVHRVESASLMQFTEFVIGASV